MSIAVQVDAICRRWLIERLRGCNPRVIGGGFRHSQVLRCNVLRTLRDPEVNSRVATSCVNDVSRDAHRCIQVSNLRNDRVRRGFAICSEASEAFAASGECELHCEVIAGVHAREECVSSRRSTSAQATASIARLICS